MPTKHYTTFSVSQCGVYVDGIYRVLTLAFKLFLNELKLLTVKPVIYDRLESQRHEPYFARMSVLTVY